MSYSAFIAGCAGVVVLLGLMIALPMQFMELRYAHSVHAAQLRQAQLDVDKMTPEQLAYAMPRILETNQELAAQQAVVRVWPDRWVAWQDWDSLQPIKFDASNLPASQQ